MKDLLTKMASIANQLDINGFEKEANEVTLAMAKMAQAVPSGMLRDRMQQGQFKLENDALARINGELSKFNLPSKEDKYYWITGKYGPRQANDWAAVTGQPTAGAGAVNGAAVDQAYEQTGEVNEFSNMPGVGEELTEAGITTRFKKVFAQTPPAPAATPKANKQQVYAFMKNAIATYANLKPSYDSFMNEKDASNRLDASTKGKEFIDGLQGWIEQQNAVKQNILKGYSDSTKRIITDKLFAIPLQQVAKMQSQAKKWLNEAPGINWSALLLVNTVGQNVRDMETNLREIEAGCYDATKKMAEV
jgi:hypothetical protein